MQSRAFLSQILDAGDESGFFCSIRKDSLLLLNKGIIYKVFILHFFTASTMSASSFWGHVAISKGSMHLMILLFYHSYSQVFLLVRE